MFFKFFFLFFFSFQKGKSKNRNCQFLYFFSLLNNTNLFPVILGKINRNIFVIFLILKNLSKKEIAKNMRIEKGNLWNLKIFTKRRKEGRMKKRQRRGMPSVTVDISVIHDANE